MPDRRRATRDQVRVEVWVERDRLHIGIQDKETGEYIISWWDDEAHQMFDQGFFYDPGPLGWRIPAEKRKFEESVLSYAEQHGLLARPGGHPQAERHNPRERRSMSDGRRTLAIAGAVVGGLGLAGLAWWGISRARAAPPPEGVPTGKLSGVMVTPIGGGTAMKTSLAEKQAAEIARSGFASPAVTVRVDQNFRVQGTVANTGTPAFSYFLVAEARGPVTYQRVPPAFPSLAAGQSRAFSLDFLLSAFEIVRWEPGTYTINVRLLDAATNRQLDEVNLPGELVISAPPTAAPTGRLSGVSVVAL